MAALPVSPTVESLLSALQNCRHRKDPSQAKRLLAYMQEHGLDSHSTLGNHLVSMLVDCGSLHDAEQVFHRLVPHRNEHSWTSLISGHTRFGDSHHAFLLYHRMQVEDLLRPSRFTYLALLHACAELTHVELGHELHADLIIRGLDTELHLVSSLVGMYTKCGLLADAHGVFKQMPSRNVVLWNALISGYTQCGRSEDARSCLQQMQLDGISPSPVTFVCRLKACDLTGASEACLQIHGEVTKRGMEREPFVGSTLIDTYIKFGLLTESRQAFDSLPVRDAVSWAALIAGYAEHGFGEEACHCFQQMQVEGVFADAVTFLSVLKACHTIETLSTGQKIHAEIIRRGLDMELLVSSTLLDMYAKTDNLKEARQMFDMLAVKDSVSWNALLAGHAKHGLCEELLEIFNLMQLEGVPADVGTFVVCLKACGTIGALKIGREIHSQLRKSGLEKDSSLGSTLIDMYGNCGSIVEGRQVFDNLPIQDVISWTAMIKAYGYNHEGCMAVQCFNDMQKQGIIPNSITFTCLLAACSHASLVLKGQECFRVMTDVYKIQPTLDHYACMVDLFARAGCVLEAEKLITKMQWCPSGAILMALLSASKIYGKVEVGERCFQQFVELSEEDASVYLLMTDIYTAAGRWSDASRSEKLRKCAGVKKIPGTASVEVNKKLYEFTVCANQHMNILKRPETSSLRLNDDGYVPNLDLVLTYLSDEEREEIFCSL